MPSVSAGVLVFNRRPLAITMIPSKKKLRVRLGVPAAARGGLAAAARGRSEYRKPEVRESEYLATAGGSRLVNETAGPPQPEVADTDGMPSVHTSKRKERPSSCDSVRIGLRKKPCQGPLPKISEAGPDGSRACSSPQVRSGQVYYSAEV
jgi:hypothetical protein